MKLLSEEELSTFTTSEKKGYYIVLKKECERIKNKQLDMGQGIIKNFYPFLRNYKLEFQGTENLPKDSNVIFLCNHSNSHDIFNAYEVLSYLGRRGSVMVATDCLTPVTTQIFNISNATLLDRNNNESKEKSVFNMANKIINGYDGVIFGESTWNIHPTLPMHNIKKGISTISAITQAPIIPTIFEYIEEEGIIKKESDLSKKCIIRFGKPIMVDYRMDLKNQTNNVKEEMVNLRTQIWNDYRINRNSLNDIDPMEYINHTYLKKFGAFGFTYDSRKEQEFLLFLNDQPKENEYTLNSNNELVPGITEKNKELKKLFIK